MSSAPRHAHGAPSRRLKFGLNRSAAHSFAPSRRWENLQTHRSTTGSSDSAVASRRRSPMRAAFVMFLAVAVLAATAILPKGMGAYSLWGDNAAAAVSDSISTGQARIVSSDEPSYMTSSKLSITSFDPAVEALKPGQTLNVSFAASVLVSGATMEPKLELSGWTIPDSVRDALSVETHFSDLIVSPDEQIVTVTITLTSAKGAVFNGEIIDLSAAQLMLSTGTAWSDVLYPLDVPMQDIHLAVPVMELVYDTLAPGSMGSFIVVPLGGLTLGPVTIDWGDGSPLEVVLSNNPSHNYAVDGQYTVTVNGAFTSYGHLSPPVQASNTALISVTRWDDNGVTDASEAFANAVSLTSVVAPPVTVTTMAEMFLGASIFNHDISSWDVSHVTDMSGMFYDAAAFNQAIGVWNVSNVTEMGSMFFGATAFEQDLTAWDVQVNIPDMPEFWNQDAPGLAPEFSYRWPLPWWSDEMVLNYDTSLPGATNEVVIPLAGLSTPVWIDWGDGSPLQLVIAANPTHSYAIAGPYTVTVLGTFTTYGASEPVASNRGLVSVTRWNSNGVTDASSAFIGASNLMSVVAPPTSVTNMSNMFSGASTFNGDMSDWNVSNVTNMAGMFMNASAFNQDIGSWDVSNVTNMASMFRNAVEFNQDIGLWDVSNVTNMSATFQNARAFDQDIALWNVANVTDMTAIFQQAVRFKQDISAWDVETNIPVAPLNWNNGVPGLSDVYNYRWPLPWQAPRMVLEYDTTLPGASNTVLIPVSGLSLGSVTIDWGDGSAVQTVLTANPTHNYAVAGQYTVIIAGKFTRFGLDGAPDSSRAGLVSVSRWDPNGVTNAGCAFSAASNLTSVVEPPTTVSIMEAMFESASAFNQDIGSWNVENVTNMEAMFSNATAFNQDIGAWNVANVANMTEMFSNASAFAQDLSEWTVLPNLPTMPAGWNYAAPGLATEFKQRWPLPWQPAEMVLEYDTSLPGATNNVLVPVGGLTLGPVTIDWGDGSPVQTIAAANPTHNYAVAGQYTVTITGKFTRFGPDVDPGASPVGLVSVSRWDANGVTNAANAFFSATNLVSVAKPPTTITNMRHMFANATTFNGDISGWNVANVTNMQNMFSAAQAFNQPIGGWNVANVTNMSDMFHGALAFNQPIGGWNVANVTNMQYMFSAAQAFNQPIGNWNVANVTNMGAMFQGASVFAQDLSAWDVAAKIPTMPTAWNSSAPGLASEFSYRWPLPWQPAPEMVLNYDTSLVGATNNVLVPVGGLSLGPVTIDWGDGSAVQTIAAANPTHNYAVAGSYTVTIKGKFTRFGLDNYQPDSSRAGLVSVSRWDANGVTDASAAFATASNLVSVVAPPTTITNMQGMFMNAFGFDGDISGWNVANVTNMQYMFNGTVAFNQPIGGWNVANVTDMRGMFNGTVAFNQPIGGWNVANVTNMQYMFGGATAFNQPIGNWNVANVTDMTGMFTNAWAFNQPIGGWNVANVTNMQNMFGGASAFNQPIGGWNVANVTNMMGMFSIASAFNQPIGDWNVANVTNMQSMFAGASVFAQDLSAWDVAAKIPTMPSGWNSSAPGLASAFSYRWPLPWQPAEMVLNFDTSLPGAANNVVVPVGGLTLGAVTIDWGDGSAVQTITAANPTHSYAVAGQYTVTITGKFTRFGNTGGYAGSKGLVSVSRWDANGVTDASYAFANTSNLVSVATPPATITNMQYMFNKSLIFNDDISGWNVANVTTMQGMFSGAQVFNQPIGAWNVANVTDMQSMFGNAWAFDQPIGDWNVANVTNMQSMFNGAVMFNQPIGDWNVANVTNMSSMFAFTPFDQPIGDWNVANVTNMSSMFNVASAFDQPIGDWNVANVTNMSAMFSGALAFEQDLSAWDVAANIPTMPSLWNNAVPGLASEFSYRWPLPWQPVPEMVLNFNTSLLGATNDVLVPVGGLSLGAVTIDWGDGSAVETIVAANPTHNYAVAGPYTVTIKGKFTRFGNTSASSVGKSLVSVSRWDANGVTDASYAFAAASNLVSVAKPPTTITNMQYMFNIAASFNGDISGWNVANVTNMRYMFAGAPAFNQPIGGWNVANVTNMQGMFSGAQVFNQPIGDWNVAKVTDMAAMFGVTPAFNQPIGGWNVANVTTMQSMFNRATAFNQPIGGWDVAKVTNMMGMFDRATAFNQPIGGWNVAKVTNMSSMFSEASLFAQDLSAWDVAAKIPTMPSGWNNLAPGLASGFSYRWPLPWQPAPQMVLNFDTSLPGAANNVLVPVDGLSLGPVTIDWGDGSAVQTIAAANPTHSYAVAGSYTATISGKFTRFGTAASSKGLVSVSRWDANGVTDASYAFFGASNLVTVATPPATITETQYMFYNASIFNGDLSGWNVANVTNMDGMFSGAAAFNQPIGGWNVANVTTMQRMFINATAFNQPIGDWNVANVTDMQYMFNFAQAFNQPIGGWNVANVTNMRGMFETAPAFNQPIGNWNVANVTDMRGMFSGAAVFDQPIGGWNVANAADMNSMFQSASAFAQDLSAWDVAAKIPTMSTAWNVSAPGLAPAFSYRWPLPWQPAEMVLEYDTSLFGATNNVLVPVGGLTLGTVTIDWGDGSAVQTITLANPTHNYAVAGPYTVTVKGKFTRFGSSTFHQVKSLVSVSRWGPNGVTDASYAFADASSLVSVATPPATITNMENMFNNASSFNGDISGWNVANVTNMQAMFVNAQAFNQPIGGWNVANVTNMQDMFSNAYAFNQPIGGWNVANVTTMGSMFSVASAFAQDLSAWNVAKIPTMPAGWNLGVSGLAPAFSYRWPLAWQ